MGDLASLGLSELEENAYGLLVDQPSSSERTLRSLLGVSAPRLTSALGHLRSLGLIAIASHRPRTYAPTPPSAAVNLLVQERQRELDAARRRAAALEERLHASLGRTTSALEVVEVVSGQSAGMERLRDIHMAARDEQLTFTKPPFISDPDLAAGDAVSLLNRGLRVRSLYDPESFATAGVVDHVRACIRGGEESRVAVIPVKLDIIDRTVAVLPVTTLDEPVYQMLIIRAVPVINALLALFELYWQRATPLRLGARSEQLVEERNPSTLSADDHEILSLLSAGQKDDAIAHTLGIADRTVGRRIARLMSLAGVKTRFQLAEAAMRQGWIS